MMMMTIKFWLFDHLIKTIDRLSLNHLFIIILVFVISYFLYKFITFAEIIVVGIALL